MLSDEQLFIRVKENDHAAFDELYNRHWLTMYNIAFKRLKDKAACSDVVQDVFTDLWNKRSVRDIDHLLPYLHTAIRYKVYSLLSKGRSGPHFVAPFESMATSTITPDNSFTEKELNKLLLLWMQTLPEKRREIFRLKYFEGATTRQISEHLNISQKTVQNQLLLAFKDLRGNFTHYLACAIMIYAY